MVSHRSSRHRASTPRGRGLTALSAAAATAATLGGGTAAARPAEDPPAALDGLYADAERATEKYNAAAERVGGLQRQLSRAQDRAARGQAEVNRLRDSLGTVAGSQYRSAGFDPALALLLTDEPDAYLARAAALERVGHRAAGRLAELQRAQRVLRQHRQEGARALAELARHRTELADRRKDVRGRLATAQRMLNRMSAEERAARESRQEGAVRPASAVGGPGSAVGGPGAEGRAGAALAAATSVLGRPYAWGQAGPSAFDCSGLTQWAYARAGVALPRTSQGQAGVGRSVSPSQAQPGDLVIYRGDASHVAIYAGGGQVIHSPYPGAAVRYDPIGMMPVSAVQRP
ncbi:NlpC/P60 family protein [Streptomyces sp. XM4193]|uniref:C40 family peptidase n=1 Tax=Streptomyces sp. XM4193 TaxID=2929782 RepID=UPI001FF72CCB|nr:C40 family peptidase [Streptomyces sp. XM4193]MCK1796313.1 NlpC/P60 family protein [Streptomyces sp. XM4193]